MKWSCLFGQLGGAANQDKAFGEVGGEYFKGRSIRTYDTEKDEWTIYWLDTSHPQLVEQVKGRLEDGAGIFYGREHYREKTYRLRFRRRRVRDNELHWDQAFQDPDTKDWDVKWIMDFRRKDT